MVLVYYFQDKVFLMTMLLLGTLMAMPGSLRASEPLALQVRNVKFIKEITPKIGLTVHNSDEKVVTAWRGRLVCIDAFGDRVINIPAISRSANIDPESEQYFERRLNAQIGDSDRREVSQAAIIVLENDAKNFDCSLSDIETVYQ